jgi:hypothetical protein
MLGKATIIISLIILTTLAVPVEDEVTLPIPYRYKWYSGR